MFVSQSVSWILVRSGFCIQNNFYILNIKFLGLGKGMRSSECSLSYLRRWKAVMFLR